MPKYLTTSMQSASEGTSSNSNSNTCSRSPALSDVGALEARLESLAKQTHVRRRDLKRILRTLVTDSDVLDLLAGLCADPDAPSPKNARLSRFEPKLTRARSRAVRASASPADISSSTSHSQANEPISPALKLSLCQPSLLTIQSTNSTQSAVVGVSCTYTSTCTRTSTSPSPSPLLSRSNSLANPSAAADTPVLRSSASDMTSRPTASTATSCVSATTTSASRTSTSSRTTNTNCSPRRSRNRVMLSPSRESGAQVMSARRRSQLMRLANLLNDETDDEYVPSAGESDVDAESELEEDDEEEEDEMERATALSEPTRADASSKQESAGALETGDCNAKPLTCARPPGSPVPLSVSQSERHPQSEPEPETKRQPGPNSSAELLADEHLSVALRTRSKQPLTDVSIADLERNLPLLDTDVELEPLSCLSSSAALLSVPPAPASPFTVPLSDALVQASPSSSTSSWQPLDTPRKGHSHPSGFTLGDLSALLDDPSLICPNPNPNPFSDCGALEADALLCASPGTSTDEEREWRQFLAELRVDSAVADAVAGATYADLFQTATNPLQYLNTPVPLPVSSPAPTPVSESHNARNANAKDNVERPNLKSTGGVAEEDEERADPSFNVLDAIADMDALDDDLREELRSDRGTRVSKRELNELLAEYYALTQGDQENANAGAYPLTTATTTAAAVVVPPPPDWGHSESPLLRQIVQTPTAVPPSVSSIAPSAFPPASAVAANNDQNGSNSHLCRVIEDEQLVSPSSSQCNSADPADSSETREDVLSEDATTFEAPLHFGDEELQLLRDQMVMHVQLLAQLGLLAGAVPACEPLAYAARFYLQELQFAARNQRSMLALTSSLFDACNLEAACALLLDNSASASSSSTASDTDTFSSSSSRALAPAPETAQAVSNSYNGLSGATLRTLVTNAAFPCAELLPLRAPFYTDTPSPSAPAAAAPTTSAETSAESSNRASREPRLRSFSAGEDRLLLLHVHHCRLTKQRCRWATFRRAMLPYRTLPQIQQRLGRLLKDSAQERQKRMLQLERSSPVPRAFTCADIPCPVRCFDVTPGAIIENSVKLARLPAELRRVLRLNGVEPISSSSGPVLTGANALAAISFSLMQTLSNSHRETRALLSTSASTSRPHCPCSSPSQSPPKPRAAGRSSHKKTTPRKQPSVSSSSSSSALGPEPELDFVFPLLSLNALGSESAAGSAAQHSKPVVRFVFDASSFQLPRPSDREPEQPSDSAPKLLFGWTRRRQLATASSPSCSPHEQHVGTAIATPNFDESALLDISRYRAVVEYDDSSHSVPAPSTAHSRNQHQMQMQNATRTTTNCQSREAELAALFLERLRGVLAGESLVEVLQLLASFGQSSTPEAHPEPLPEPANDSCGSSGAERSTRGAQAADTQTHAARLVERFVHLLRGSLGAGGARAGDDGNSAIRMRIRSELLLAEFAAFLSTEQARASGMLERHRFVHQLRALAASIEASLVEQLLQQRASRVQLISENCDGSDQQQKQQQVQELSQCSSSPVSPSSGTGPGESSSLDDDHWTRDEDSALLECYLQHEGREVDSQLVAQLSAQLVGRSSAQIRSRLSFLIAQLNQME